MGEAELYGAVLESVAQARRVGVAYAVAVPSYRRPDSIAGRTLATLDRLGTDRDRVTVFVADEAEREAYAAALGDAWRVVVGRPGLDACQKWYANEHYPAGTRILTLDDDIEALLERDGNKVAPYAGSLDQVATLGWGMAEAVGAKLWGLAAAANGFYMHDEAVAGLRFIIGCCFGSVAGDPASMDPAEPPTFGIDWRRSIRSFLTYGATVRLDWLAPKTSFFAEGGVVARVGGKEARTRSHSAALRSVVREHPKLARLHKDKAGVVRSLRLKPVTLVRIRRQALEAAIEL